MEEAEFYIRLLDEASPTIYGEKLIECMEHYNVYSLQELSVLQLREYCLKIGVI